MNYFNASNSSFDQATNEKLFTINNPYQYITKLTNVISNITNHLEKINPHTFNYNGANLKIAITKQLFAQFSDDPYWYKTFVAASNGIIDQTVSFNPLVLELLRDIAGHTANLATIQSLTPRPMRIIMENINLARRKANTWRVNSRVRVKTADIVFHLDHPSFLRFIKPITKHLSSSWAILVLFDHDIRLIPILEKEKIPYIMAHRLKSSAVSLPGRAASYFPHLLDMFSQAEYYFIRTPPKAVVVLEGDGSTHEVLNTVSHRHLVPTICIQQGWAPYNHTGFQNMSFTNMAVWGQGFADLLQPNNPKQKFTVTGSSSIMRQVTRSSHRPKGIAFYYQLSNLISPVKTWSMFTDLALWVAESHPQMPIYIREHPRHPISATIKEKLSGFTNVAWRPADQYDLIDVLEESEISVCMWSTTILESIALGVVPFIFNLTSLPAYWPDIASQGAGLEVKNIGSAKLIINKLIIDKNFRESFRPAMQKIANKYFSVEDKPADQRIAEQIRGLYEY